MRLTRALRCGFALLLTLMLPLQGYAAMPACGPHGQMSSSAADITAAPAAQHHCARGSAAGHRHHCGNCCCGAPIAFAQAHWVAPLLSVPKISSAVYWPPPVITLDRLDRPPRPIPA